jgi:hypothetical protein
MDEKCVFPGLLTFWRRRAGIVSLLLFVAAVSRKERFPLI